MIIYSEKTKQKYSTVAECEEAEKQFDEEIAKKNAEKKALADTKKSRADGVMEAYKKMKEAEKEYLKLRNAFIKDYGYFHMSYTDSEDSNIFTDLFSMFRLL